MDVEPSLAVDLHHPFAVAVHSEGKLCQSARYVRTLTVLVAAGCFPVDVAMQNSIEACAVHDKDKTWPGRKA